MAKERHLSPLDIEGSAAKVRMSSIPPQIQRGIESGTFPIERFFDEEAPNHIWVHLEKRADLADQLAKPYDPHSGGHHLGLYVLTNIDEYFCLPDEVKNTITPSLLRFIKNGTDPIQEPGEKKHRLPSRADLRLEIFAQVMKIANTYENHPNTPQTYPDRINFWFHQTTLFQYSVYLYLPSEIKKSITPHIVAFMRANEDATDEEIEIQIAKHALHWIDREDRNSHELTPPLPIKTLREWKDYLLQSPISIQLMRDALFQRIDDLLNES